MCNDNYTKKQISEHLLLLSTLQVTKSTQEGGAEVHLAAT